MLFGIIFIYFLKVAFEKVFTSVSKCCQCVRGREVVGNWLTGSTERARKEQESGRVDSMLCRLQNIARAFHSVC